ncbi:MAG: hypothetical protein AAFU85_12035 [Planctomycetota bacterium]
MASKSKTKARIKAAKARKNREMRSNGAETQARVAEMTETIVESFPIPEKDWPGGLRDLLEIAVKEAVSGRPEMLEDVFATMRSLVSVNQHRQSRMCSDEAAKLLDSIDPDDAPRDMERVARKALDLDPNAIDAMIALGDLAENPADRIEFYRRASRTASTLDDELIIEVMPSARSHMSTQLRDLGLLIEAAEILEPALDEDPDDLCDAASELVSLYLTLEWFEELDGLLQRVEDDDAG